MAKIYYYEDGGSDISLSNYPQEGGTEWTDNIAICDGKYDIYLRFTNNEFYLPEDSSNLFSGAQAAIGGLEKVKANYCTNMSCIFKDTQYISFAGCANGDTSNVTDFSYAFSGAEIDGWYFSNGNTSSATNMTEMFSNAIISGDVSANISNGNTSNVTTMYGMFHTSGFTDINCSGIDTYHVTDFRYMFYGCDVPTLDVKNFDTRNVTSTVSMFENCQVKSLDLSNGNMSSITDMSNMFKNCSQLNTINNISNKNVSNCTDFSYMFYGTNVKTLDIRNGDLSNGRLTSMFEKCGRLVSLHIEGVQVCTTGYYTQDAEDMFSDCENLVNIYASPNTDGYDGNHIWGNHMFINCYSIPNGESGDYSTNIEMANNVRSNGYFTYYEPDFLSYEVYEKYNNSGKSSTLYYKNQNSGNKYNVMVRNK